VTVAICIKCGATKHGALTPCRGCGFIPEQNEDKAKAMIVTYHFLSHADLEQMGDRIRRGLPVQYPEDAIQKYVKLLEENPGIGMLSTRFKVGCTAVVLLLAVAIGFIVWIVSRR
jgi:hypothetical protein